MPTSRSYFSYPNRGKAAKLAIRNRVLRTIQSTWGGHKTRAGLARAGNGRIRIATWSFKDWTVARALVAAHNRGASVQVVAAKAANKGSGPWRYLRKRLGGRLYKPGHPTTRDLVSFARQCRGACRGPGGTAHAKYFLFDRVGARRARHHLQHLDEPHPDRLHRQWNQAQVMKSRASTTTSCRSSGRRGSDDRWPGRTAPGRSAASSTTSSPARAPGPHRTP